MLARFSPTPVLLLQVFGTRVCLCSESRKKGPFGPSSSLHRAASGAAALPCRWRRQHTLQELSSSTCPWRRSSSSRAASPSLRIRASVLRDPRTSCSIPAAVDPNSREHQSTTYSFSTRHAQARAHAQAAIKTPGCLRSPPSGDNHWRDDCLSPTREASREWRTKAILKSHETCTHADEALRSLLFALPQHTDDQLAKTFGRKAADDWQLHGKKGRFVLRHFAELNAKRELILGIVSSERPPAADANKVALFEQLGCYCHRFSFECENPWSQRGCRRRSSLKNKADFMRFVEEVIFQHESALVGLQGRHVVAIDIDDQISLTEPQVCSHASCNNSGHLALIHLKPKEFCASRTGRNDDGRSRTAAICRKIHIPRRKLACSLQQPTN
eukprot:m.883936 g.883936  ORF g.883936 m.883936 type:complete len:386 (-) comp59886_c1_seq14:4748-5905(-)